MKKVIQKQYISKMCFICGQDNPSGIKARFYELENGEVASIFTPRDEHQSYPDRLHGGVITALLDELIGRAIIVTESKVWGVTVDIDVKFKKPVPLERPLRAVGRITQNKSKMYEGTAELLLENGTVAAVAWGKYLKTPIENIDCKGSSTEDILIYDFEDDVTEVDC